MRRGLAGLLALVAACGDDGGDGGEDRVRGTQIDRHLTDRGPVEVAHDLSAVTISAIVEGGDGSLRIFPGTGEADGSFEIPGVPEGRYLLRLGAHYLETEGRSLDLGRVVLGRPDARLPTLPTTLVYTLANGLPWGTGSRLDLTAANVGLVVNEVDAPPGVAIDWNALEAPLVDAGRGDLTWAGHLTEHETAAGQPFVTLVEVGTLQPFTMRDGQTTTAQGTLVAAGTTALGFSLDRAPLVAMIPTVHPAAVSSGACVEVFAQPPGLDAAPRGALLFSACPGNGALGVELNAFYGTGYPDGWARLVETRARFVVSVRHPDAVTPLVLSTLVSSVQPLPDPPLGLGLAPRLGPPRDLTVNGADATAPLLHVGDQPVLAWSAPALGRPTDYLITLHRITSVDGATRRSTVARLQTPATRLRLPPGLLEPGGIYLAVVESRLRSGADPTTPFREGPTPSASAGAVTSPFAPATAALPGALAISWTVNGAAGHCPASGLGVMTVTVDTDLAHPHVTPCETGRLQLELPAGTYGVELALTDPAASGGEATARLDGLAVATAQRTSATVDVSCQFCP